MILIKKINKKYKNEKRKALNNISVKLPDTGLIFITGESGSGKSTLLNIIGGLDKPDSGDIIVDGKNLFKLQDSEIDFYHKQYISFIYQQYNLIKHATVSDNITIFNNNKDYKKILDYVGLNGYENKMVNELSGGEQQRVSIARALIKDSRIILCDEPTGALDDENGKKIMEILKDMSKTRLIIVVTHNNAFSNIYADRILHMKDGEIISDNKDNPQSKISKVFKLYKCNYHFNSILSIIRSSLKYQKKRNILMTLAISFGLSSLLTVLSINSGFKTSITNLEEESLASYPLFISKDTVNIETEMNNILNENNKKITDKVSVFDLEHKNIIDSDLIEHNNSLHNYLKYIEYNYIVSNSYVKTIPNNNKSTFYSNFKMISGVHPISNNEVLLVINSKNQTDKYLLNSIGLNDKEYDFEKLIGYTYKLKNNSYKIVGIATGLEEKFYYDTSSIYYLDTNFREILPESFYLFPKDKNSKDMIKESLQQYDKNLYFTDYAKTISNVSITFIDAISLILIIFSSISLIVSAVMIAVITHISILERTKEIGILRSLGFSKFNIVSIFTLENIIAVLLSSLISIIFVTIISRPFNSLVYNYVSLSNCMKINFKNIFIIIIISIIVGLVGSLKESYKTSKLNIIDSIRYE